jgi:hypothetical protein
MADENKVLGIRLDAEERKRFDEFVSEEGKNNKDFLNTLLNLYELNKGKVKNINLVGDIETLESYTSKIQQTFINIIDKLENQKGDITEHSQKDLQIYKDKVNNLEFELDTVKLLNSTRQKELTNVNSDNVTLKEQYIQLQDSLQDKLTIIKEYQGKNDTLAGLVNEYKSAKAENVELKDSLNKSNLTNLQVNNENIAQGREIDQLKNNVTELSSKIEALKSEHKSYIDEVTEKSEVILKKAIQDTERVKNAEMRESILKIKEEQQEKIQAVQNENAIKINEYQDKYKSLLEELEHFKAAAQKKEVGKKEVSKRQTE